MESSIRIGARAAAVDERDDGGALSPRREGFFFAKNHRMSTGLPIVRALTNPTYYARTVHGWAKKKALAP